MRLLACLIVAPQRGYDEPAILSYATSSFCPTSADGLHRPSGSSVRTRPQSKASGPPLLCRRLRELGWIEGRTVAIEYRWAEGRSERFAQFAAEFVRQKVDVILTHNTPPVLAAKQATSIIPIVFATAADPVGTGVVASLARPGGNVTGLSSQTTDVAGKRIELLREVVPGLRRFAILASPDNSYAALEVR